MNLTLKENGEVIATIVDRKVTKCEDEKVREFLEAMIANNEISEFPAHIDRDQMLKDVIQAFAFVNSYELD